MPKSVLIDAILEARVIDPYFSAYSISSCCVLFTQEQLFSLGVVYTRAN